MKVALAQINPTVGDIDGNVTRILEFGERSRQAGASLVVFPEMAVCGYPPMDLLLKGSFIESALEGLARIAAGLPDIAVLVGCPDHNQGTGRPLRNGCALLAGGEIQSFQYKTLLPTYDVFDEDRYFEPATDYKTMPVGSWKVAVSICEDIWNDAELYPRPRYQTDPIKKLLKLSPELLVNISASPYSLGKEHIRHELVRNQALKTGLPVVYVNQVGGNDELVFDGRSIACNGKGELIAAASAFAEDLIFIDLEKGTGDIRQSPADNTMNIYEALTLGTRDYMRKCLFKKAVVGLSGGIDSAVVCAIACRAVGAENVLGVSMPSPYSSAGSLSDARRLAENLGIEHTVIPISEPMKVFAELLLPAFAGKEPDATEENIQARLRGLILMSLSNKFGYLVLTTGNKSELAVGYCTLYGDMCGGLAVISDLPKMMVYDLARYINEEAGRPLIPESTIEKAPSAELKPDQRDQDTLPPYVVLDGIINAYVEQHRSPDDIVKLGYKREVVIDVIGRIDRNEYKRHQAAPGLKVTARSFGFGWRMPIAQKFREKVKGNELLC